MNVDRITSSDGGTLAVIVRANYEEKSEMFTSPEDGLQAGIFFRNKGYSVAAHTHPQIGIPSKGDRHEVIYVIRGEIILGLVDHANHAKTNSVTLHDGDLAIIFGPHSAKFGKDTKFIEIKQGPFPGKEKDKRFVYESE